MEHDLIYLLTDNIFFSSKIAQNLKASGVEAQTVTKPDALAAALAAQPADAVLVNLNARGYDPVAVIRGLKAGGNPPVVIAFCGHSDTETMTRGKASGADRVVANSAITMNAAGVLRDAGIPVPV
jgi:DNA-binding response OmpR family regulator